MSMQHKYCFEVMHCTFQNLLSMNDHVFDRISIIFDDNFVQILSVIQKNN